MVANIILKIFDQDGGKFNSVFERQFVYTRIRKFQFIHQLMKYFTTREY